jgi:asparagine synthase (glutamine-hydrolysing)
MCGIVGVLNLDEGQVSAVVLERMTAAVAHRGPDGDGTYIDGPAGLGHRRLAIIDLSPAASQPMISADGRYALIYNGEIYNFQELKLELQALGYQFRSRGDTEVLLYAYHAWGAKALDRLNGMFAFAVWDRTRRELFLARDRYGIKPLYYTLRGHTFLFASEIKALLAHPDTRVDLDKAALLEYFTFQNLFTDRTFFSGIHLLTAGTFLRIGPETHGDPRTERYWDYQFIEPDAPRTDAEYAEELDRLIRQAVRRQLVSDVDVGAYLSGGMDSGTVTAIAATQLPYLKSFTCGFDMHSAAGMELSFDERDNAELMSYRFKTEHYEMVLKAGDMERIMPRLVWHLEELRLGQSYPNFYVAQLASKFVKVVLSGCGGDELFGGYPWRYYRAVGSHDFEEYVDNYYRYWQRLIPNRVIQQVFEPIWPEVSQVWTRDIFRGVFARCDPMLTRPEDYINHSLYFEAKTFLHGLLWVEDKLSMAHGLETRIPFLDNELVDFAMRLPVRMKLSELGAVSRLNENEPGKKADTYFSRTKDGKVLLRKVMARNIPGEIAAGKKQGFAAPDASWFKGESIEYVRRELLSDGGRLYEYMDREAVRGLINEHLDGRQNRRLLIWSLLSFECWLRHYLN